MVDHTDLSLVLPCYNEAAGLRSSVLDLVKEFSGKGIPVELVLVDNGSSDGTGELIDELISEGLPVVKQTVAVNVGYGNGVLTGLRACRSDLVGFLCADGQVEAADVVRIYEVAARASSPKLVKVRRRFRMDGFKRKIVSIAFNMFTLAIFGNLRSIDINGNPKILPRAFMERMNLRSKDWFLDAEVMIKAKHLGLDVFEMNVFAKMREEGVSHVRAQTCWEFVINLVRYRVTNQARKEVDSVTPMPASS